MTLAERIEDQQSLIVHLKQKLDVSPWRMGPKYRAQIAEAKAQLRLLKEKEK